MFLMIHFVEGISPGFEPQGPLVEMAVPADPAARIPEDLRQDAPGREISAWSVFRCLGSAAEFSCDISFGRETVWVAAAEHFAGDRPW